MALSDVLSMFSTTLVATVSSMVGNLKLGAMTDGNPTGGFDVGETLVDESRSWGEWADWLGVTRLTFFAALGAVIAAKQHHNEVYGLVRPGIDLLREREARQSQSSL